MDIIEKLDAVLSEIDDMDKIATIGLPAIPHEVVGDMVHVDSDQVIEMAAFVSKCRTYIIILREVLSLRVRIKIDTTNEKCRLNLADMEASKDRYCVEIKEEQP